MQRSSSPSSFFKPNMHGGIRISPPYPTMPAVLPLYAMEGPLKAYMSRTYQNAEKTYKLHNSFISNQPITRQGKITGPYYVANSSRIPLLFGWFLFC